MVGIQFIVTMSFSFLTPIMPLFLPVFGVPDDAATDMWSGIIAGSTSFVGQSPRRSGAGLPTSTGAS